MNVIQPTWRWRTARFLGGFASVLMAACLALVFVSPAWATGGGGAVGWEVIYAHAPTVFEPSAAKDDVQRLTIKAIGGDFVLARSATELELFPWNASHEEVQEGLERLYGSGNVDVEGGPGDADGTEPYIIRFVGAMADQSVPLIEAGFSAFFLEGEATLVEIEKGQATGIVVLTPVNTGSAASMGVVTVTDELPNGMTTTSTPRGQGWTCSEGTDQAIVSCTSSAAVAADSSASTIAIEVAQRSSSMTEEVNRINISGGSASATTTVSQAIPVGDTPAGFGVQDFSFSTTSSGGGQDLQAGSHPYSVLTDLSFDTVANAGKGFPYLPAGGDVKDVSVKLPAGLIGDPSATPRCTQAELQGESGVSQLCPAASQIGTVTLYLGSLEEYQTFPLFNMVPPEGLPAQFDFNFLGLPQRIDFHVVREGNEYSLSGEAINIPESAPIYGITLNVWGVPADASHDAGRQVLGEPGRTGAESGGDDKPLIDDPTDCEAENASTATVRADSWSAPGSYPAALEVSYGPVVNCGALTFNPKIMFAPEEGAVAGAPSGYEFGLEVPQRDSVEAYVTPQLKEALVTLPEGVNVSPSAVGGLVACTAGQIALSSVAPATCPPASKIGTALIETPLLEAPLRGRLFLATPECSEVCSEAQSEEGRMIRLYLQAEGSGVRIKLPGSVELGGSGTYSSREGLRDSQLRVRFDKDPQLPFSKLVLTTKSGQRAPLIYPRTCGAFEASARLEPWSAPFTAAAEVLSRKFAVVNCKQPSFAPAFTGGTLNNQGGAFSPFITSLSREDSEAPFGAVSLTMPRGLVGELANIPLCGEDNANAGTCSSASQIGTTSVDTGPGSDPYQLDGKVYLTAPYGSGQFGLSIVVPTEAGPFRLAGTNGLGDVVVRAEIRIDPRTAQVSVVSGELPTVLQGVVIDLRAVHISIDRERFVINPTNCKATEVAGAVTSAEGATHDVSGRFQVANCATLGFKPTFAATTRALHTRKGGAYLSTKITSGPGQANLRRIHVTLPGKLPSRLETLKQACTEAQFAANPAGCPEGAFVGTATVRTPVLPVPLTGPAIFVSHGGAGFPNLDFVLQGDGVTIIQEGDTFINKKQVTTSTFPAVPDVPVEAIELQLPEGPHSALAANGNLCERPLYMPTELAGQNGAVVAHRTKIKVTGCKPAIQVLRHRVKGTTATIVVRVPMAGKLIASGHGISRVVSKLGKAKTTRLKVSLSKADRRLLAKHPGHSVRVDVKLKFKPSKKRIKPISNHVTVLMR